MKRRTWTDEQLLSIVPECTSIRQVLMALGLVAKGGNFKTIKTHIARLGLDTSHITGKGHGKGYSIGRPLSELLVVGSSVGSHHLKMRLLKAGILQEKCYQCGIQNWLDKPLSFHLDHINGINVDNRLTNLRLVCPNCHSQTETYCGKNIGKGTS